METAEYQRTLDRIESDEAKKVYEERKPLNLAEQKIGLFSIFKLANEMLPKVLCDNDGHFIAATKEDKDDIVNIFADNPAWSRKLLDAYIKFQKRYDEVQDAAKNSPVEPENTGSKS